MHILGGCRLEKGGNHPKPNLSEFFHRMSGFKNYKFYNFRKKFFFTPPYYTTILFVDDIFFLRGIANPPKILLGGPRYWSYRIFSFYQKSVEVGSDKISGVLLKVDERILWIQKQEQACNKFYMLNQTAGGVTEIHGNLRIFNKLVRRELFFALVSW